MRASRCVMRGRNSKPDQACKTRELRHAVKSGEERSLLEQPQLLLVLALGLARQLLDAIERHLLGVDE